MKHHYDTACRIKNIVTQTQHHVSLFNDYSYVPRIVIDKIINSSKCPVKIITAARQSNNEATIPYTALSTTMTPLNIFTHVSLV